MNKIAQMHPGVHILNQKKPPVVVLRVIVDADDPTRVGVVQGDGIEMVSRAALAHALLSLGAAMSTPTPDVLSDEICRVTDPSRPDQAPGNGPVADATDQGERTPPP